MTGKIVFTSSLVRGLAASRCILPFGAGYFPFARLMRYELPRMMNLNRNMKSPWLVVAVASMVALPAGLGRAQSGAVNATPEKPATSDATPAMDAKSGESDATPIPDRAKAYYHLALANTYEEDAITYGSQEYQNRAIDEYKTALNADPDSPELNDGLADLYFRIGRVRDAETTAKAELNKTPGDLDAHKLLGRIYLRELGDGSTTPTTPNILEQAIAEYVKIVTLDPKSVEDRMVLGQLYTFKHEPQKAEEQFKTAQALDPDSEEVVLNLARLYAESGDVAHAAKVIEAVPEDDRSSKMEFALGAAYDQLKRPKDAIAAYQRAADLEPEDVDTLRALAQALLNDNQLDAALKQYKDISEADPDDVGTLVHVCEIQRRQGKFDDALATIRKAVKKEPDNLEAGYNEGILLDHLGHFDEAAQDYEKMVELTSHANGAYTADEKNNRGIFLERLASVYHEQNKTDQAIATYQKMIDLGGDLAERGYEGQVEAYHDAMQYDKAVEVARKAVDAKPKDRGPKLVLAEALVDQGKPEDALTLAKEILDNSKDDRTTWLEMSEIDKRLHRWKDAEDALNKAGTLTTDKSDQTYLLFLRGALAERQKHYEPAEQYFRQVLDQDPQNAMTLNYLGYMLADRGTRLPEALKMIRQAVDLDPANGAYLDSLGWAYFKLGQYELAEDNLRKAVERTQSDPTVHDHLGDLYEKTGRIRLAAAQWELSIAEYAKSATAADIEPSDVAKVQHKLESARIRLAKQEVVAGDPKPE
jgi:tetratricopeptide (TPR) repeat protein